MSTPRMTHKFAVMIFFVSIILTGCHKEIFKQISNEPIFTTSANNSRAGTTGVTLAEAKSVAENFFSTKHHGEKVAIENAITITHDGIPYLHIINAANKMGFVILSADSLYPPILAFDTTSNFTTTSINPGVAQWMNKHGQEIYFTRNTKNASMDSIGKVNKKLWGLYKTPENDVAALNVISTSVASLSTEPPRTLETILSPPYVFTNIGPMLATQFSQKYPYNQYCPNGSSSGGRMPAGCVPVAMAQIMYYWQFPTSYDYNSMVIFDQNNSNTWPVNNPGGYTETARLIHDIGTTPGNLWTNVTSGFQTYQFTLYDDAGSSSNTDHAPEVFAQFGYPQPNMTQSVTDQVESHFSTDGTYHGDFLMNEILNKQIPCLVGGYSGLSQDWWALWGLVNMPNWDGHEWVCDGLKQQVITVTYKYTYYTQESWGWLPHVSYQNGGSYTESYLHMNWGWGGTGKNDEPLTNNGWYNYAVNYTQMSPQSPDFQYFQSVIYDIRRP